MLIMNRRVRIFYVFFIVRENEDSFSRAHWTHRICVELARALQYDQVILSVLLYQSVPEHCWVTPIIAENKCPNNEQGGGAVTSCDT
jgi:hypothetical protein